MHSYEAHNGESNPPVEIPTLDPECEKKATQEEEHNWVSVRCRRPRGINHAGQWEEYNGKEARGRNWNRFCHPPDCNPECTCECCVCGRGNVERWKQKKASEQ